MLILALELVLKIAARSPPFKVRFLPRVAASVCPCHIRVLVVLLL